MTLPADTARCEGGNCPSRFNCLRFTERKSDMERVTYAALYVRREAGASACDLVIWASPVSTFKEN
jgi:hypothetical protein